MSIDPIRTLAEALSSGPALIAWCGADGMRWGNALQTAIALNHASGVDDLGEWFGGWFCNAIETARDLDKSRIAAPDDETLAEIIRTGLLKVYGDEPTYYDPVKAILAAFREAGALR